MLIVLIRTLIVFAVLFVSMRVMGKRQLGELEVNELVIAILISNFAAHPLQDIAIPLMNGILPIIILLCCELILSGLVVKSTKARAIICGKPSILISAGKINQEEMVKNRFTLDELAEELRNQSVMDISTVQYAVLETDGRLNVIPYPDQRPLCPAQLGMEVPDMAYPIIIINNGRLLEANLQKTGRDSAWLDKELRQRHVKRVSDVYYMTVDTVGNVYFAKKETRR